MHHVLKRGLLMNSFERRVRAFSIDLSLATVLFLLFVIIAGQIDAWTGSTKLFACAVGAYFGVLIVPNLFSKGQSFGKRTQKMMVVNIKTNQAPTLFILILRELFKGILMIMTYGFYMMICGIMFSSRKDGRVVHDLLFKTKVVCLTRFVSEKEGSVLNAQTGSVKENLKGSSYDD
jgi:uncharacterized RDD family membrane protein YckC